jgi:hypothetical protein
MILDALKGPSLPAYRPGENLRPIAACPGGKQLGLVAWAEA